MQLQCTRTRASTFSTGREQGVVIGEVLAGKRVAEPGQAGCLGNADVDWGIGNGSNEIHPQAPALSSLLPPPLQVLSVSFRYCTELEFGTAYIGAAQ